MQRKGIGVANLPNLKHNHFIHKGCTFNIMTAGSHGLGKTTFLNQFIGSNIIKYDPFVMDNNNLFYYNEDICNIQTSYLEVYEGGFLTKMNITEVDCIGDSVDNTNCYEPIVQILENNMKDYHSQISKKTKNLIEDKRIHLCLYFLEPIKSIKIADLEVLKKISKYCTIIPIIAKSDLLNGQNYSEIKLKFREILDSQNISYYEDKNYPTEAPYLFYCSEREKDLENTNYKVLSQNFEINEFSILKKIILEKSIVHFLQEADEFYDNYRVFSIIFQGDTDGFGKSRIEKKIEEYEKKINEAKTKIRAAANDKNHEEQIQSLAE